jgi:AcrR family transcriptional regulator
VSDAISAAEATAPARTPNTRPMAPAKLRILETADALFTQEGIRSVGIDRLISESRVTKATFYKHYGSKDRLIGDYVAYRHRRTAERIDSRDEPREKLEGIVEDALTDIDAEGFRGDAFLNAAAEFPDPGHPVRAAVRDHREWLADALEGALRDLGHPLPGDAADELVLARDGALSGAYAGDPIAAKAALGRVLDRLLAA